MNTEHNHTYCHSRVVTQRTVCKRSYRLPVEWENAIDGWLNWLRLQGHSEATLRTRRGQVRVIARHSHTRNPRGITLAILVNLCGKPGISADHRHGQRAALVSFFAWCTENQIVTESPAAQLPSVRAGKPRPRPAPDNVWTQLLASAAPREALMALLACEAGLRRAEVAQLHYEDLLRDDGGYSLIVHGKGGRQRIVPITDRLAGIIRQHCEGGYVFPGAVGGHLSPDAVGRLISRLMPTGWTMHKLRHRFATNGFNGTHNLLAMSAVLGHSSVATTQRYIAVTTMDLRAVSDAAASDPKRWGSEQYMNHVRQLLGSIKV